MNLKLTGVPGAFGAVLPVTPVSTSRKISLPLLLTMTMTRVSELSHKAANNRVFSTC